MSLLFLYPATLLVTIIVEYLVILLMYKGGAGKLFLYLVLINSFTQPIAAFVFNYNSGNFYLIEFFITITESLLLMLLLEIPYKSALLFSITANLVTATIGWFIFIA